LPITHITGVTVDGRPSSSTELPPEAGRVEFNYVGRHLSAPESIEYSYILEGLDNDWIPAERSRQVSYNNLSHGHYRFLVRATEPEGHTSEAQFAFTVLPHFYQTSWFILLVVLGIAGALYAGYRLRIAQVRHRYALVVEERGHLAREIHDTLAQGFVGIAHQLDALAARLESGPADAREHLDLARKMTRHSLTEARRSLLDLRLSDLQEHKLPEALSSAAQRWVAGNRIHVNLDIREISSGLSPDCEQNLFRIAQEAVANVVKHAKATAVSLHLMMEGDSVLLAVADNGAGFDTSNTYSSLGGNFGIIGMRERAERIGGTFSVASEPGTGTRVEVKVPSPSTETKHDRRQEP
jgi:signal transduction histidine kinase